MRSNAEVLFSNLETIYNNIFNLLDGFQKAASNNQGNKPIKVTLNMPNNQGEKEITINSFQHIISELNRLNQNFDQLTRDSQYIISENGEVKKFKKLSALNAEYISEFKHSDFCLVDENKSLFNDFIFPQIKLPIQLDSKLSSTDKVLVKIYEIKSGFEKIKDNIKELELNRLIETGEVIGSAYTRYVEPSKRQITHFGKFNIENFEIAGLTSYRVKLNTLFYGSKFTLKDNLELKVDDILVHADSNTNFKITNVFHEENTITIESLNSNSNNIVMKTGIDKFYFNQKVTDDTTTVINLPIKPSQKIVCFFSTENLEYISFPSNGVKIDSTDFKVSWNNVTYTIDEFYSQFVTNFSEYLTSLVNETNIPYSLGVKPNKPILNVSNFKVVQINKHLVNSKTKQELESLNKQKQSIQNDIEYRETIIKQTQNEIDTLKFNSIEEKTYRLNKINTLRNEVNVLKTNMLTIIRDIDTNATKDGLKTISPKYRILGYWEVQEPMFSPNTKLQHIIKYEVQYRYLSKGIDTFDTTSYKMVMNNGKGINVAFSNWIEYPSTTLSRKLTVDGKFQWEQNLISDTDNININQCSISINESESVEIRIRAVSEAGYPIAPMKSEWSEIIRVDFPDYLKDSNIKATIDKNNVDLNIAEFNQVLVNNGLLQHISNQIYEGDKLFFHHAKDISSGQYTSEQKNIPLDVMINTLVTEINKLKGDKNANQLNISFINDVNERYIISNNTTLDIFVGNYIDDVLSQEENFGKIVQKKYYISIKNNNQEAIELRSLIPNEDSFNTESNKKYRGVPVLIDDNIKQKPQQILYFRRQILFALNDEENLIEVVSDEHKSKTYPQVGNINTKTAQKNLYGINGNALEKFALLNQNIENMDFVGYTTEIEKIVTTNTNDVIKSNIERLSKFGNILAKPNKQFAYLDNLGNYSNADKLSIGFNPNLDIYSVGKNSCGAWLYPYIDKLNNFTINGNSVSNFIIIEPNSEILIPIIFQYRMQDRLGNIYPNTHEDTLGLNLEYKKKLGVSMKLNSTEFNFDIQFTARYKSKVSTYDNKNLSKIVGAHNSETKETLV